MASPQEDPFKRAERAEAELAVAQVALAAARAQVDELAEQRNYAAGRAAVLLNAPPDPVITEYGPERALLVTWPDGRPEWSRITPEAIESMAHEVTALRTAAYLRRLPWWQKWRVLARA